MEQAAHILFWFTFAGLCGASVLFAYQMLNHRHLAVPPQMVTGISLLFLTASIGLSSVANGGTRLTGGNQMILAAWALCVLFFVFEYVFKFKQYGGLVVPVAVILLAIAQITSDPHGAIAPMPATLSHQMASVGIGFHVLLMVFANMLFIIGALASAGYLYQAKALKQHSTSLLARRLPSLANCEHLASRSITIALPIYLGGQFLGVLRAIGVDAAGWYVDPRVMLSGLVLGIFMVFAVLYLRNKVSGQVTSWIAVVGGILVLVLMVLARTVPVGFHIFGTLG